MEQLNLFEALGEVNPNLRECESTDWKWSFKDYPKKEDIKVFSCFACGGGSTMGYKLAGCEVLGDLEIDPKINKIYVKNHKPKYNYVMDIREFNELENIPEELYDLDILDGSPPCTTFSMIGGRESTWGVKKKFAEGQAEQTLDDLCFHFIDTVNRLRPKMVIMENVEGLILGNAWGYVQQIYSKFKEAGYTLRHYLLKGETMGVPQNRHRVFFIAARNDINFNFDKLDMSFNYKPVTYGDIKTGYQPKLSDGYIEIAKKAISTDKSIADTRVRLGLKKASYSRKYVRKGDVLNTLTSVPEDSVDVESLKYISIETAISAQTFAQDYDFDGASRSKIFFICGMSVPPVMIKRIVNRIKDTGIFKKDEEV